MNDDSRIIGLFFERSEQAIAKLSERYGERCRRVARNIVASDEDADECVSDAFLAVWERIPPERPDPLVTYLLKIVRNTAMKKLRSNTALKRGRGYDAALDELEECLPSGESVEGELEARELASEIDRFLHTLERDERVLFMRRYWFGDSISELAKLFGIRKHAVTARLYRTREKLRKNLMEGGTEL